MRTPRLRRLFALLGGALLGVALVTSLALVTLIGVLTGETMRVTAADARMRASLRTKVALLWYARASDFAISAHSVQTFVEESRAEADLRAAVDETARRAGPDAATVQHLRRTIEEYIFVRRRLESEEVPLFDVVQRAGPTLEACFADVERLVSGDETATREAETSAERWGSLANALGSAAAVLLLVAYGSTVASANLLVERPVLALTTAMTRFAEGDETARVTPHGALELRQAALAFDDLAERLVRQRSERLAFLAGVAHDLRNPLSAMRLATHLGGNSQPPTSDRISRMLATVGRQVDRLDRMVGDLLDATRIESGHVELRIEPLDLRPLLHHVCELMAPISEAHAIDLRLPLAPTIAAVDPTRFDQVVTNLVSNAIKYSPGGGRIIVQLEPEPDGVVVEVTDSGLGIPADQLERIFEPFHRSPSSSKLVPGVGLGLSVSRKLVEAQGGRLDVRSRVDHGSTFRLWLPACPSPL